MDQTKTTPEMHTFYSAARNVKSGSGFPVFIIEEENKKLEESFWASLDTDLEYFSLDTPYIYESLVETIQRAQNDKRPLIINIQSDLHPLTLSLLDRLANEGFMPAIGGDGTSDQMIPITVPIFIVLTRTLLEEEISYKNFYQLLGAGFSIR